MNTNALIDTIESALDGHLDLHQPAHEIAGRAAHVIENRVSTHGLDTLDPDALESIVLDACERIDYWFAFTGPLQGMSRIQKAEYRPDYPALHAAIIALYKHPNPELSRHIAIEDAIYANQPFYTCHEEIMPLLALHAYRISQHAPLSETTDPQAAWDATLMQAAQSARQSLTPNRARALLAGCECEDTPGDRLLNCLLTHAGVDAYALEEALAALDAPVTA